MTGQSARSKTLVYMYITKKKKSSYVAGHVTWPRINKSILLVGESGAKWDALRSSYVHGKDNTGIAVECVRVEEKIWSFMTYLFR